MTNSSSSKQQHCSGSNSRIATHRAGVAEIHDRCIQIHTRVSYSSVQYNNIFQVQVLCCEAIHGASKKERLKKTVHHKKKGTSAPRMEPMTSHSRGGEQASFLPPVALQDYMSELYVSKRTDTRIGHFV